MREIKFRQPLYVGGVFESFHFWGWFKDSFLGPLTGIHKSDSQQFTGLHDKNGKEIYEGDLFNSLYEFGGCKGKYIITYDDRSCSFYPKRIGEHQQKNVSVQMWDMERLEIIGNVFENHELFSN